MVPRRSRTLFTTLVFTILLSLILTQPTLGNPTITIRMPQPNETIHTDQPTIRVNYSSDVEIIPTYVTLKIDGHEIGFGITKTSTSLTFVPIPQYHLADGLHNVSVEVYDANLKNASVAWSFVVNTTGMTAAATNLFEIVTYILIGSLLFIVAFCLYILYLKKTRKFTFKKFFAKHPVKTEVKYIYIPMVIGFFFTIFLLIFIGTLSHPPRYVAEYAVITGFLIAVIPYTIHSQRERWRMARYERAFAQFLFEMADAMRGGLDPLKAITEISMTHTGALKASLKKAAENIKMGRPFEEIMMAMTKPIKSDLIQRYATLIGDTSKIGGETSLVIYRAAKDMDDFIKISQERRRQLSGQTFTIYIGFGVILAILYLLINIFPSMGELNISLLSSTSVSNIKNQATVNRISQALMKQRFFHMMLVYSIGTGTVIGMFVDGKIKNGLLHSIILTVTSVIVFGLLIS